MVLEKWFGQQSEILVTYLIVPAIEVPETLHLVSCMELLAISRMSEVGNEHKVGFKTSFRLKTCF